MGETPTPAPNLRCSVVRPARSSGYGGFDTLASAGLANPQGWRTGFDSRHRSHIPPSGIPLLDMLSFIFGFVVGAVVAAIVTYLFLRKNPAIAAQANAVVKQIEGAGSHVTASGKPVVSLVK